MIPLGGMAGGVKENVQRWRGQIGLARATDEELGTQTRTFTTRDGTEGWLVDLVGGVAKDSSDPPTCLLGAIIPYGERTWFLKAIGPQPATDRHRDAFVALCESIRFDGDSREQ